MKSEKVLQIVLREMMAVRDYWRSDWSDFDGRTLECQLEGIEEWANKAVADKTNEEYTEETDGYKERSKDYDL